MQVAKLKIHGHRKVSARTHRSYRFEMSAYLLASFPGEYLCLLRLPSQCHYGVEVVPVLRIHLTTQPGPLECLVCALPSALAGELPAEALSRLPVVHTS